MTIRIHRTSSADRTVLQIDGWLRAEDVDELVREYEAVLGPVVLELSNLQSADPAGVRALLEFNRLGAQIQGASPYVELLLERDS